MPIPFAIDFKNPDYQAVFEWRAEKLDHIRQNAAMLPALYTYYRDHPIDFIEDWGMTFDPRNVGTSTPAAMPFIMFPRQREWCEWLLERWKNREPGLTKKSRDVGASWLACSMASSICMFNNYVVVGFGSRKEEYVDKYGSPKALFPKIRQFIQMCPREFRGGWDAKRNSAHMRISFPLTGSTITGEAGDNIGRGDRTSIYFVDESAHLERPAIVDAALSATTNCRIDMSSVNGSNNPFAEKCRNGKISLFVFSWRHDPRKDDAWYEKQNAELDPVTVAQEIDMDENASTEGIIIPNAWLQACVDAHIKLKLHVTGQRRGTLDIADEGKDSNCFVGSHGIVVEYVESWSGKGDDIFGSVEKCFDICDLEGYDGFEYDADGLGAGCRGDARVINQQRALLGMPELVVEGWRGSAAVQNPEREFVPGRKNEDYFANAKAQGWFELRRRCQNTFRAVTMGADYNSDEIISFSSGLAELQPLLTELSQPTYLKNSIGKMLVDKKPDGAKSPNRADGVMMRFAPKQREPVGFFDL